MQIKIVPWFTEKQIAAGAPTLKNSPVFIEYVIAELSLTGQSIEVNVWLILVIFIAAIKVFVIGTTLMTLKNLMIFLTCIIVCSCTSSIIFSLLKTTDFLLIWF